MSSSTYVKPTKEEFFKGRLEEMGLWAKYRENERVQYGVTQHRLQIRIYRGSSEVAFTTGGYWGANSYRESAFEQGIRKLGTIDPTGM